MDQLGVPPEEVWPHGAWFAVALAGAVGFAGIALWNYLAAPGATTKKPPPRRETSAPSPKARKPAAYVPSNEAEDLLAASSEDEQNKLGPLMASLAPTNDFNAQIKAARATLFYVQDENQWALLRRTGVLAAMVRLLVSLANRAAQRDDGNPSREEAAVLAALVAALRRLCRSPDLREAMVTPELVQHAVYLLHTSLVDATKAGLVEMLNVFAQLSDDRGLRKQIVAANELGSVLSWLFMQAGVESDEDIIKQTANALAPLVALEEDATRSLLLEQGATEHALRLFNEGRPKFAKRKTPLALLSLLNSLAGFVDADVCEKVLSQSLAQYFVSELRKNQKVALRKNLPEILSLLHAFLVQERNPELEPARKQFQDFFLEEQEDGTTGVEQVMSFLKDEKVFAEAADVLLGLSLNNTRVQTIIKENEEAMANIQAAKASEALHGSEHAEMLLARLGP